MKTRLFVIQPSVLTVEMVEGVREEEERCVEEREMFALLIDSRQSTCNVLRICDASKREVKSC